MIDKETLLDNDRLWDVIDAAVVENDRLGDDKVLAPIVEQLRKEASAGNDWLGYPLGYVLYCHKSRMLSLSVQRACEECLTMSIQCRWDDNLAKIYLAFHNYDIAKFELVEVNNGRIDFQALSESMVVRYREICLCARIKMFGLLETCENISQFATYVSTLEGGDAPPTQLIRTLGELPDYEFEQQCARQALSALDSAYPIMGVDYFSKKKFRDP